MNLTIEEKSLIVRVINVFETGKPLTDNLQFRDLLRRAGRDDPVMQSAQDQFFDERYFKPAMRTQAFANQCTDCTVVLFAHVSTN